MMAGANPVAVQRILRHSDPKITTEVYGHLALGYLRADVDRLSFNLPEWRPSRPRSTLLRAQIPIRLLHPCCTTRIPVIVSAPSLSTDGEVFPICAVARRGGEELAGKPGKWPKSVELQSSSSSAFIVEEFI